MIFSPVLNFSDLSRYNPLKRRSGIGTVLLDPKSQTLSIRTGTDLITARYLDTTLQSGDSIRYTLLNDILLIEKVSPDQQNQADSFIRQQPTDINKITGLIDSLLSSISQKIPINQIKLDLFSILESLNSLPTVISPELIQNISSILHTKGTLDSDSIEKLRAILIQLRQDISNPLPGVSKFLELPVNNLPDAIYKSDSATDLLSSLQLSGDLFSKLNNIIEENNYRYFRVLPCGTGSLMSLISTENLYQELKFLTGKFTSPQMQSIPLNVWESILNSKNQLNLDLLNTIDASLTSMQIGNSSRRAGSESAQHSTLTQWLLTAIDHQSILHEMIKRYPATVTSIISTIQENSPLLSDAENFGITEDVLNTIKNKEELIPLIIKRLGYDFDHRLSESEFELKKQTSLKKTILCKLSDHAVKTFSTSDTSQHISDTTQFRAIDDLCEDISEILKNLPDFFRTEQELKRNVQSLDDSIQQIKKTMENGVKTNENIRDPENKLLTEPELMIEFSSLFSNLQNNITVLQNSLQTTRENFSPDLFAYLIKLCQKTRRSMENLIVDDGDIFMPNALDMKSTASVSANSENAFPKQVLSEKPLFADTAVSNQLSKPVIDSLLNHFESLQLLGRTVSTSDGTQQVLALPMNVNGEWTEVNIRLLKRKNNSQRKKQSIYKVDLDVAPSRLGSISVQMEYELKKRFNLKISFNKNHTLEWFSKNRESLSKSLSSLGLPLVSFLLQSEVSRKCESESPIISDASFDVKI